MRIISSNVASCFPGVRSFENRDKNPSLARHSKREHVEEELMISLVVSTLFYHLDSLQYPAQFTLRMT